MNYKNFKKLRNLDKKYEIWFDYSNHIFWIGNSGNIAILNECNKSKINYTNLGYGNSYEVPEGM